MTDGQLHPVDAFWIPVSQMRNRTVSMERGPVQSFHGSSTRRQVNIYIASAPTGLPSRLCSFTENVSVTEVTAVDLTARLSAVSVSRLVWLICVV